MSATRCCCVWEVVQIADDLEQLWLRSRSEPECEKHGVSAEPLGHP